MRLGSYVVSSAFVAVVVCTAACSAPPSGPQQKEQLGSLMFSDPNLSNPTGQSCADCHTPSRAFTDPESDHSTSSGAVTTRFGPRNAPTAMYASHVPALHFDGDTQQLQGGLFWDGRADTLEHQAAKPLLNPLEMNNPDKASVVATVRQAAYAQQFRDVFGATSLDDDDQAFAHVTEAIAAFERTQTFSPFSSKYDQYLAGKATLSDAEQRGLAIFEDPKRGNCASCHPSRPAADGTPPLFTNHGYANLGIPKYKNSLYLVMPAPLNTMGDQYIDHGLMNTVSDPAQDGKFRVPTLRNVAHTGPYGHNGYFENVEYIVDFLNTRDVGSPDVGAWPPPEVPANVDKVNVGHLGLSQQDVNDLVAFLSTLSDGYKAN
jgi:cytochrome c peroxidase